MIQLFVAAPGEQQSTHPLDRWLAKPMFLVSVAFLLFLAGILHLDSGAASDLPVRVCEWGLAVLYPLFLLEFAAHLVAGNSFWKQNLLFCLIPPLRIGARDHIHGRCIWLPFAGWMTVDRDLRNRIEKAFSIPMIGMAFLVLPLMGMEWAWSERISDEARDAALQQTAQVDAPPRTESASAEDPATIAERARAASLYSPHLAMFTQSATAFIWVAFTLEFIVMISIVEQKLRYCKEHSIDIAVILLPLAAFLRAARLGRLLRLQQLTKTARVYRIRGLLMKTYRAILLLELFDRLARGGPQTRLARLRDTLAEKEMEVEALRKEICELEETIETPARPLKNVA